MSHRTRCVGSGGAPQHTNIVVFGVGDLQSGNLQSRATDFGSHNTRIVLVGGERPEDINIVAFGVGDLQSGNLQYRAIDFGSHTTVLACGGGGGGDAEYTDIVVFWSWAPTVWNLQSWATDVSRTLILLYLGLRT